MSKSLMIDDTPASSQWLQTYYYTRAAASSVWIALALTVGRGNPLIGAGLMIVYPAWDAIANWIDAGRSGGLRRNPTQTFNLAVSVITAIAVIVALQYSMFAVLGVFSLWAIFSGLLQLATAVRRWKFNGAQWVMILSGAQSNLGGFHMGKLALGTIVPDVTNITLYAGFGAFYFLVSAIWLTVSNARKHAHTFA